MNFFFVYFVLIGGSKTNSVVSPVQPEGAGSGSFVICFIILDYFTEISRIFRRFIHSQDYIFKDFLPNFCGFFLSFLTEFVSVFQEVKVQHRQGRIMCNSRMI